MYLYQISKEEKKQIKENYIITRSGQFYCRIARTYDKKGGDRYVFYRNPENRIWRLCGQWHKTRKNPTPYYWCLFDVCISNSD